MEFTDKEKSKNKIIYLLNSDDRENVDKYAMYIRSNNKDSAMAQYEIQEREEKLKELCKKNNYNVTYIYIDEGFSGRIDSKRLSFNKMIEDVNNGKINGIIAESIEQLVREDFAKTTNILENIKNSGAKIITVNNGNLQDIIEVSEKLNEKYLKDIKKLAQKTKREEIKNKNKTKER